MTTKDGKTILLDGILPEKCPQSIQHLKRRNKKRKNKKSKQIIANNVDSDFSDEDE